MNELLEQLLQQVSEANTVGGSLITLCDQIKAMLDAALAGDAEQFRPKVEEISALIAAQKQEIADAVVRNTPSGPAPEPV